MLRRAAGSLGVLSRAHPFARRSRAVAPPTRRGALTAAAATGGDDREEPPPPGCHLASSLLSGWLAPYWAAAPTAEGAVSALEDAFPGAPLAFDHVAFRTLGLPHLGIASLAPWLEGAGYARAPGELRFPGKRLRAAWWAPPHEALPRVFVSELLVEELSPAAQCVIRGCVERAGPGAEALGRLGPAAGMAGAAPWAPPAHADWAAVAGESEYGAWVLAHGYCLNHATVSVHRLRRGAGGGGGGVAIAEVNALLQRLGVPLNGAGGVVKASPDGLLLQSSSVADRVGVVFAGEREAREVPGPYIEFAERRVLPQFAALPRREVRERHRRDGFEVASADRIFESTTLAARGGEGGG